jgi:hypothetical protein
MLESCYRFTRNEKFTFFDTCNTGLLSMRRDRCIVSRCVLRRAVIRQKLAGRDRRPNRWSTKHDVWVSEINEDGMTYGATGKSAFLFLIGSDIAKGCQIRENSVDWGVVAEEVWQGLRKNLIRFAFGTSGINWLGGIVSALGPRGLAGPVVLRTSHL